MHSQTLPLDCSHGKPIRIGKLDWAEIKRRRSFTVISTALVVRSRLQVLEQVRTEHFGAVEVRCDDGEEPPAALARVRSRRFVVGRLFHDLTVDLVAQCFVFVTILKFIQKVKSSTNGISIFFGVMTGP